MSYTTIKVSKNTLKKLHRIVGELTLKRGKRVTLEDAILYLLDKNNSENSNNELMSKIERDRKAILKLMEQEHYGIDEEDLKEFDFDYLGDYP